MLLLFLFVLIYIPKFIDSIKNAEASGGNGNFLNNINL